MKSLFAPAIALMNSLKYPQKFVLIGLLLLLPLVVVMRSYLQQVNGFVDFAAKEQLGLQYNQPLARFLQQVQQHSALNLVVLNGNIAFKDALKANEQSIATTVTQMDAVDKQLAAGLDLKDEWPTLKKRWETLLAASPTFSLQDNLDQHIALDNEILGLLNVVGNNSNLILDPDIDTYYLMDSLIIKLPTASENLAQVRSYGLLATERKSLTPEEKTRLTIVSGSVRSTFDAQFKNLQYVFNYNPPLRTELGDQVKANLSTVDTFLTSVNKDIISRASAVAFSPARLQVTSDDYFKNSTNTIDQSFKLLDVLTPG